MMLDYAFHHYMEQSDPYLWACMHLDTATPLMALTHMPRITSASILVLTKRV